MSFSLIAAATASVTVSTSSSSSEKLTKDLDTLAAADFEDTDWWRSQFKVFQGLQKNITSLLV